MIDFTPLNRLHNMAEAAKFIPLEIAVLTISDSRTRAQDTSGQVLVDKLEAAGHRCADRELVRDDKYAIRAVLSTPQRTSPSDVVGIISFPRLSLVVGAVNHHYRTVLLTQSRQDRKGERKDGRAVEAAKYSGDRVL